MFPYQEDTIAAIATPAGAGGIGIIRISGGRSIEIVRRIFRPRSGSCELKSHRLYLGHVCEPEDGNIIDQVLVSCMRAPHSYTREDVVEINSHSGFFLLAKILQTVLDQGARLAGPGEFTYRAFLNGRIDLTQAEAVVDLINSKSDRGIQMAVNQVQGTFRQEIDGLKERIMDTLSHVEVAIDYPEEESDVLSREALSAQLIQGSIQDLESLTESVARRGLWVDGIRVVIAGAVNVGKSSLLNRLIEKTRSIVTAVPGTTRDVIESSMVINGLPVLLMDTAGFRETKEEIETVGILLTLESLDSADLVLAVLDRSRPLDENDRAVIHRAHEKNALVVLNKADLPSNLKTPGDLDQFAGIPLVAVSALTGEGIDRLREAIFQAALNGIGDTAGSAGISSARHRKALDACRDHLLSAADHLVENSPMEIVALELREGLSCLGEIVGETTNEDILKKVFSQFCIGK
jgi:tRNA modification GTPase